KNSIHASGVNGLLEAMAMGKPTIVSNSEGIRDFVTDGETCLLTPVGDSAALRSAIDMLITENDYAEQLGRKARDRVEQLFSSAKFARRLATAIREVKGSSKNMS